MALLAGVLSAQEARGESCAARHEIRPSAAHFDLLANAGAMTVLSDTESRLPISPCAGLK